MKLNSYSLLPLLCSIIFVFITTNLTTRKFPPLWVGEIETASPTKFTFSQNYPNPFNPITIIKYAISSRQYVTLKVYDVLGNEIATFVSEEKPTGSYEVEFNSA